MRYIQSICLLFLVLPSHSRNADDINCKLKPGCFLTHCDPIPAGWDGLSSYLRRNEFPLMCESKSGAMDVRQEMAEFKQEIKREFQMLQSSQQSALNSMQKKLDSAEMLLKDLLRKQQQQYLSPTKEAIPRCPEPQPIPFAEMKCSTPSVCEILCREPRIMQGEKNIYCQNNGKWSKSPTCVCKECTTGENCEFKIAWENVKRGIGENDETSYSQYAGNEITCKRSFYLDSWKFQWDCKCHDGKNKQAATCEGYRGGKGACEHAAAQFIKKMVDAGIYPAPCDVLPRGC